MADRDKKHVVENFPERVEQGCEEEEPQDRIVDKIREVSPRAFTVFYSKGFHESN